MAAGESAVDPVRLEVLRHALAAAAEEMSLVVTRSARSPLLREAGDHSSAITDSEGCVIAQGRDIPMHLGVLGFTVREFLKRVPAERLRPGDVWLLNLPEAGGNHLPDVKAIRPVFDEAGLLGFAVSLAHWADIGGAAPGSYFASATDAWQEGLRIPPLRIFSERGEDREKLDLVLANLRGAAEREGDILAQAAATRSAEDRLLHLSKEYGPQVLRETVLALHDRAEALMHETLAAVPDGTYRGEDWLDDDGVGDDPLAIRVRVDISGETASFDFSDTDDACRGPVNTTPFIAAASVHYVVRTLFAGDASACGGAWRPVKIITRRGSLLDPGPDRPVVGGNHETSQRIADAVFRAFEAVALDRLTAGSATTSGLLLFGGSDGDGRWRTLYETHGGGEGARVDRDGMPAVRAHMSNVRNTPAEVIEAEYPIRVERQALRHYSGGGGLNRGGDGLHRSYRVLADGLSLTTMFERRRFAPYGLAGGEDGAAFRVTLHRKECESRDLPGKTNIQLRRGDLVEVYSCGGGGYGTLSADSDQRDHHEEDA